MQSNCIRPRRTLLPQRRASSTSSSSSDVTNSQEEASSKDSLNAVVPSQNLDSQKKVQFSVPSNAASQGKIFILFFFFAYSEFVAVISCDVFLICRWKGH